MGITVSDGGSFTPHPEGQFRAVCVDVVEMRDVATQWGPKTMIRLVWQTEETLDSGKPALISSRFGASLSDKSRLRPFIEAWRGKAFTPDELKKFDLEVLLGVNAVMQVTHVNKDGKVYDNISAIMRPMKGMEKLTVQDYVRVQDRPIQNGQGHAASANGHAPDAQDEPEDDLPF
jgi:hypothetical protein